MKGKSPKYTPKNGNGNPHWRVKMIKSQISLKAGSEYYKTSRSLNFKSVEPITTFQRPKTEIPQNGGL